MLSYIGKRILSLIPVLFVVSFVVFLVVLSLDRGGTSPGGVHFSAGCGGDGVLRSHYGCVDGPGGGSQSRHSAYADRSGIATGIGDVDGGADVAAHGQSGRLAGGTLHAGERVANRMGIAPGAPPPPTTQSSCTPT